MIANIAVMMIANIAAVMMIANIIAVMDHAESRQEKLVTFSRAGRRQGNWRSRH